MAKINSAHNLGRRLAYGSYPRRVSVCEAKSFTPCIAHFAADGTAGERRLLHFAKLRADRTEHQDAQAVMDKEI